MRLTRVSLAFLLVGACSDKDGGPSGPSARPAPVRRVFLTDADGVDTFTVGDDGLLGSRARQALTRGAPGGSVVAGGGKYLYRLSQAGLEGHRIDPATGGLAPLPGSPFATHRERLIADPRGRFLWTHAPGGVDGTLFTFRIEASTGALSRAGTSANVAYAPPPQVEPQGRFAFATQRQNLGSIASMTRAR